MKKRIIIPVQLKNFLLLIMMIMTFITVLSLIIVGKGDGKFSLNNSIIPEFFMKSNNIIFNKNSIGEPKIKVYLSKENRVEEMYFEEYVRGVVAAEMPAEFGLEALKAQAVAARTFAAAHMEEFGGHKYKSDTGANVCDTVQCQAFVHKEERLKSWPKNKGEEYWNKLTEAVKATEGEVLTYDGKLVMEPYYFAVSSGKTENAQEVFADDEPYLKSVDSPGEENAPKYRSSIKLSYSNFIDKINSQYPNSGLFLWNVKNQVEIKSRSDGGSVKEIKIGKVTITGSKFRSIMELNSANFNIKFNISNLEIDCIGYGHDVGMSQWGANAMAKEGRNYREILTHYYSGVDITKINNYK